MGIRALAAVAGVLGALVCAGDARAQEVTLSRAVLSVSATAGGAVRGRLPARLRRARALELDVDGARHRAGIRTAASCARAPALLARLSQAPPAIVVPGLRVARAGVSVAAPLFSFCSGGLCGDGFVPRPAGRLPVLPGGSVVIESSDDVTRADATLLRHVAGDRYQQVGTALNAERITARRWRVTLPVRHQGAGVLMVSVAWPGGDATGAAGLRERCSR